MGKINPSVTTNKDAGAAGGEERKMDKTCVCGRPGKKRGWTNCWYCCEQCELSAVSKLHGSMPGAGPVPYPLWVPHHIGAEIKDRWADD